MREPDTWDSNKRRWPTVGYWLALLGTAQRIRLYEKPGAEYNLYNLEQYVYRQAGNAISALLEIQGEEAFKKNLKKRGTYQNPKYTALVEQYSVIQKEAAAARMRDAAAEG